ncbi:MAG TPA: elongation factor P [Alphaproteobacteria bacterium]
MKVQANTVRAGHVLEYNGKQYTVLGIGLLQPGKGGAFIQVEMRDLRSGLKTNVRWRTQESVERLHVDEKEATYLFGDDDNLTLMDTESFEQFPVPRALLGDAGKFLQDGMALTIDLVEGQPVAVHLPQTVTMKIVEADPVVRGQTASSSYKPAILENGARIMVPPHIESGTRVVVNTGDGSYVERAKD